MRGPHGVVHVDVMNCQGEVHFVCDAHGHLLQLRHTCVVKTAVQIYIYIYIFTCSEQARDAKTDDQACGMTPTKTRYTRSVCCVDDEGYVRPGCSGILKYSSIYPFTVHISCANFRMHHANESLLKAMATSQQWFTAQFEFFFSFLPLPPSHEGICVPWFQDSSTR